MPLPKNASDTSTYGMPQSPQVGWVNFQGIPKTDPQTDQDASEMNVEVSDLAQMTRMTFQARIVFTTNSSNPIAVVRHDALWGNGSLVVPTVSRAGLGHYTITWPASVTDPLNNTVPILLHDAHAQIDGSGLGGFAQTFTSSANTVEVYTFDTSFAASDLGSANVKVWVC